MIIIVCYNQSQQIFSQYCDIPVSREMVLVRSNDNVLRASVIEQVYSAYPAFIVDMCFLEYINNPACYCIEVNIFNQTSFILATAGGPSRSFLFDQIFVAKKRIVQVLICYSDQG